MHVFVAGGAGYIGSVLVPRLLEQGHRVTVLDRFYFGDSLAGFRSRFGERLRLVRGDVRSFEHELLRSVDGVVDLSGISNDPSCELEPELTRSVNVDGAKRLAVMARESGVRRYVFSSSCSVYGHGEGLGLGETSPRRPVSLYARTKADAEDFLFAFARASSDAMGVTCLRLATVFGLSPRMRFDLAINVMTKNAYVNRRITVEGGGRQWRPFVHVCDVARAFELALTADRAIVAGEVFNVGSDASNVQILNLAFRVRDAVPGTEVVHAPTDPDLRDYNVSFDKIQHALAFRAERTIDDGIREVLGALREGVVDPDDRRCYTLRQYAFLRDAERAHRELAIDGQLLSPAS
ncbi:MAG TPA: NAD-dependent epimerase/dehydratase family protein [Polyangiaceae bacterium]|nr:NAD-dependent epimerase/dehydratase family protein [Polyangiaceae bacterium]